MLVNVAEKQTYFSSGRQELMQNSMVASHRSPSIMCPESLLFQIACSSLDVII